MRRGITHMLPTEDAIAVGEELARRFGLPLWQFTLTATDANRFSLRLARRITGRSKIVVHDECYHGSVDETLATLDADGRVVATRPEHRPAGRSGPDDPGRPVQRRRRARASARRRGRGRGPRRAGPDERRHRAARARLPRRAPGADPPDGHDPDHRRDPHDLRRTGRHDGRDGLDPDMLVIGKTIGGGIPVGSYGMTEAIADRIRASMPPRRGRRRGRRNARRLRAVAGGDPGDPRRGPDRRGLRADDPARASAGRPASTTSSRGTACRGT